MAFWHDFFFNFSEFYGCDSHALLGGRFQLYGDFSGGVFFFLRWWTGWWFQPTHLEKYATVKLGIISPGKVKNKKMFETTT